MTNQPEALRLAKWFETSNNPHDRRGAVELRRLHEVNQELVEALKEAADGFQCVSEGGAIDFYVYANDAYAVLAKITGESNA